MIQRLISRLRPSPGRITRFGAARLLILLILAVGWLGARSASPALAAASTQALVSLTQHPSTSLFPQYIPDQPEPEDFTPPGATPPAADPQLLLPDLRTLPPYHLKIETLPDGSRELRLSNTIWNSGGGPLELEGKFNPATRTTRVEQHIHTQAGLPLTHLVGEFVWHPQHDHWHFESFSLYELWTLTPDGRLDALISSSDKVSYCVIDTDIIDRENKSFEPRKRYAGCGRALQGLSPGWGDTYKSFLDGQSIHLAGVKEGFYALKSTANPDAILLESSYHNNAALLYLDIRGERIEHFSPEELFVRQCQAGNWRMLKKFFCWS